MAKQKAKQFLVSQNVPMFIADPASDSAQLVLSLLLELPTADHLAMYTSSATEAFLFRWSSRTPAWHHVWCA